MNTKRKKNEGVFEETKDYWKDGFEEGKIDEDIESKFDTIRRNSLFQCTINDQEEQQEDINESIKEGTLEKLNNLSDNIFNISDGNDKNQSFIKAIRNGDITKAELILESKPKFLKIDKDILTQIYHLNTDLCLKLIQSKIQIERSPMKIKDYFASVRKDIHSNLDIINSSDVIEIMIECQANDDILDKAIELANNFEDTLAILMIKKKTSYALRLLMEIKNRNCNLAYIAPLCHIAIDYESFDVLMQIKSQFPIEFTTYEPMMVVSVISSIK